MQHGSPQFHGPRPGARRLAQTVAAAFLALTVSACSGLGSSPDPVAGGEEPAAGQGLDAGTVQSLFTQLFGLLFADSDGATPAPAAPAPVPVAPGPAAPAPAAPAAPTAPAAPAPAAPAAPAPAAPEAPAAPARTPEELEATLVRMVAEETGLPQALVARQFAKTGLSLDEALAQAGLSTAQLSTLSDEQLRALVQQVVAQQMPQ